MAAAVCKNDVGGIGTYSTFLPKENFHVVNCIVRQVKGKPPLTIIQQLVAVQNFLTVKMKTDDIAIFLKTIPDFQNHTV